MATTPTNQGAVIADPTTYVGQNQPIGGTANLANPPSVNIAAAVPIPQYPADTAAVDAFSRLRTSASNVLLDAKFRYDKLPILFDEYSTTAAGGSGTVTSVPSENCVQLEITAGGGFKAPAMTSHQRFLCRAGQSRLIYLMLEANPSGAPMEAGVTKRAGYYDKRSGGNGFYLEMTYDAAGDLTTPAFVIASTTASGGTSTSQASWNQDKLDGTGASGITLNFNYVQILVIDLPLAAGRVRWGFDINGQIIWAHYDNHANLSPFIAAMTQSSCLPIRFEIFGNNVNAKMNVICCSVIREGGDSNPNYKGSISTESVSAAGQAFTNTASGECSSLLSIRVKSGYFGVFLSLNDLFVVNTSNQQIYWEAVVIRGYPAAGADFAWNSLDDATEYSLTQVTQAVLTAALVDGKQIRLDSGILLGSGNQKTAEQFTSTDFSVQVVAANAANQASGGALNPSEDILMIRGRGMGGAGTGHVGIGFDEYY